MKEKILYNVTYTSIDNKVRELTWNATHINKRILSNIIEHIQTGSPLDETPCDDYWNLYWGICLYESSWSSSGHSRLWSVPNKTQYTFYDNLVKDTIIKELSKECSMNESLGKEVLKAATSKAKQMDETVVAKFIAEGREGAAEVYGHDYRDALTRAKRRLRYYQKRYTHDLFEEIEYGRMIEEYNLFNILSIQRCS